MTIKEHIENLKAIASDMPSDKCSDWIESLMAGVKALEQQSTDAVDRQRVLEIIEREEFKGDALFEIKMLAPVTPPQKIGHWEKDEYGNIHCTFCGCNALYEKIHYPDDYFGKVVRAKSGFCPTCGAKMQEVRYGE